MFYVPDFAGIFALMREKPRLTRIVQYYDIIDSTNYKERYMWICRSSCCDSGFAETPHEAYAQWKIFRKIRLNSCY